MQYAATLSAPFVDPRARLRNYLHLLMALAMLWTNTAPVISLAMSNVSQPSYSQDWPVQPQIATVDGQSVRAPYLPGRVPAAGQALPAQGDEAPATVLPRADVPGAPGDTLLPAWLAPAAQSAPAAANPTSLDVIDSVKGIDALGSGVNVPRQPLPATRTGLAAPALGDTTLAPSWFAPVSDSSSSSANTADRAGLPPVFPANFGAAQCVPAYQLAFAITPPPLPVSRGNVDGDVYTVTVTNNSAASVPEISLNVDPNVGFLFVPGSAAATSNISGTLGLNVTGDGTPGTAFTLAVMGNDAAKALAPSETMTFTFRLATDAGAKSGQLLTAAIRSGDPTPGTCKTVALNIPTVRGNLTILKTPRLQTGSYGEVITWTVTLKNTGLGTIYDAVMADTLGAGYAPISIEPPQSPVDLAVNEEQSYIVSARIESCTNLTQTAAASWSIGNADGAGTVLQPVRAEADVVFAVGDPTVAVEVGPIPPATYCGPLNATVPVTVTNSGEAARDLALEMAAEGVDVTVASGPWSKSGDIFTYTGGAPAGTLLAGETLTFDVLLTTPNLCELTTASLAFAPTFRDVCNLLELEGTPDGQTNDLAPSAPTLNLTKSGGDSIVAGDTFTYVINVSGADPEDKIGGLYITDVVPSELTLVGYEQSAGTITQTGSAFYWQLTPGTTYSETLVITVSVPTQGFESCGAGGFLTNRVDANADVCPECDLSASAEVRSPIEDFLDPTKNTFSKTAGPVALCAPNTTQQVITAVLSISSGITWTGSIYTDTLGAGAFAAPFTVVPGTVRVEVDGIDRTDDVLSGIVLGPPLVIDLAGIGVYSDTANITIIYQISAGVGSIVGDAPSQTDLLFSEFQLNGPATACDGGNVGFVATEVTLQRGDLSVDLVPDVLQACRENTVTINVTGADAATLTDHVVITFTAGTSDIFTPTNPTLGGAFENETPNVARSGNVVTFTFGAALELDAAGSISFPLFRPCGAIGPLNAELGYQDQCATPRAAQDVGGLLTDASNVTLFVTPDRYVINDRSARWRFYVSAGGEITATTIVVTNTLPPGVTYVSHTVNSTLAPPAVVSSVISDSEIVAGRQILTFTIPANPGLPAGTRLRFDVYAAAQACVLPGTVDIRLTRACGAVAGACNGAAVGKVQLLPGVTSLLSSNNQTANLPLCEQGEIKLVVKNTSAASDVFDLTINDVITSATYVAGSAFATVTNAVGDVVDGLANISFTPTVTSGVVGGKTVYTLTWTVAQFDADSDAYKALALRAAGDSITIVFKVQTDCSSDPVLVQSFGQTHDVCNLPLSFAEDSKSLITDKPDLVVVKQVRNATAGGVFGNSVFAGAGDSLTWQVTVRNDGPQRVTNLFVEDQLPAGATVSSVSPDTSSQTGTPPLLKWHELGGETLESDGLATYLITTTVGANACTAEPITNTARASYGCGVGEICLTVPVAADALVDTKPALSVTPLDAAFNQCGPGTIQIGFSNSGAPAQNVVLTYTLPAGFAYNGLASESASTPMPASQPAVGATGTITWVYTEITQTINILRFDVAKTANSVCVADDTVDASADIGYEDSCGTRYEDVDSADNTITFQRPDVVGTGSGGAFQTPVTRVVAAGQVYTWTISLRNIGDGAANNVVITETLDADYLLVAGGVSTGTGGGNGGTPVVNGNVIVWTIPTWNANGTFNAVVTATVADMPQELGLRLEISNRCGDGTCVEEEPVFYKYASALSVFEKSISPAQARVGELVTTTISANLFGDYFYATTVLSDALPAGLGYRSSELLVVTDVDKNAGGPFTNTISLPTAAPGLNASGDVIWNLGTLTGQVRISGIITAVVQNILFNQDGITLTNRARLTYIDDGQPYEFEDEAPTAVIEPDLIIEKSVTPQHAKPGDTVIYTIRLYHSAASNSPAYNVTITDVVPAGLAYLSGSWDQALGPGADLLEDNASPLLQAFWNAVPLAVTQASPIQLRYSAVIGADQAPGSLFVNTATTQWTSLPDDPAGETRDGNGGVNDYNTRDNAEVALSDVSVLKTGPLTVTAGSVITYRITGVNVGPYAAVNAHVVDTMPFQVHSVVATYQVGGVSGACSVTKPGDHPIVDCTIAAIPVGVNVTVLITGVVDADTPEGADLTNVANITVTTPDGNTTNNEVSVETEVYTEGDLSVDKTGPITATAGALVTYTVVLNNDGPSTSRSVDLKDLLPPGVTWVGGGSSQGVCVNGICQLGDVPVGQPVTMVITALVGSDVTGIITNTAQSFTDTRDPNPNNDRDTWETDVSALTALRVAKVDLTDPVYAGDTYFYEIVVTNTGPSVAENVVLVDTLPGEVTFEGTSPECSVAGGEITCQLGSMRPGEVRDFLVNVRVDPAVINGTVGTNVVDVTTSTPIDVANSVLQDTELTTYLTRVGGLLDLQLTKTVTPSAVINGGQVTYTLVVTNIGPATASAVQVVDAFPREFDFVSAVTSKDQGLALCSNGVVCDLGVMAVGEVVEITLVFDVPSDVARQVYTNTAHVSSPAPESNYTNNTDSAPVSVSDVANLQIRKETTPDAAEPGGPLQYNIAVSNSGPSDAENVTVSDVLPTGFIPTMIVPSRGDCNAFPCNLGTIAAGGKASILVVGTVAPTVVSATEIQNTATVTSATPGTGDTDTASPALDLVADLEVVKTGTATAKPGEIVTYTVNVHNLGPGTATQVRITDTLPAGLTYAGVLPAVGCSPSGNQVLCTVGDMAPQTVRQYVISATVNADVPAGASLQNSVTAAGVGYTDPNPANNSDNADTSIIGAADLVIDKRQVDPVGAVTAGELVTYVVTITNTGPGLARSVDVKDQLPPGMTLERISANDGVCGGAVCQFGTLAAGDTRTVTVVARVGEDVTAESLVNVAGVFSADDPDPAGANQDQVETPIDQEADITVNKVDLIDPVSPGGGLLYQITVRNDGPSSAPNVIVTDTLDANVTFAEASPGCAANGGEVVCTVGDLAPGEMRTFLIAANASQSVTAGQTLANTVIATTTTLDPTPDNRDTATTTVTGSRTQADVGIEKTTAASAVIAGERITYTLSVTNAGPAAATNARVLELVPAGTSVVSMATVNPDDAGAYCSLGGACYLGTIISGTTALITVTLDVAPDFESTTLVNTAHVSADQADPNTANNIADETTPVQQSADVSVVKSDLPDPVSAGEVLLYQIVARNDGPSVARNVTVTDTLDANLAYVGSSPGCSVSGNLVTCLIGDLAPGETRSVFVQGRVDPNLEQNTTLNNNVSVASDTPDPNTENNSFDEATEATVGALPPTDLTIVKDATPAVIAGELVTYTLVVTNLGPTSASGVHVVDALPAGVQAESVTSSQGTCNLAGVCLLGALEVSATIEIAFVVRVDSAQTADLLNVARVAASNPELNEANNVDSAQTTVTTTDGLSILKTGSTQVTPGGVIAYQIAVNNAGPSDATNVVISDTLPLGVINATAAASRGGCSIASGLVTCIVDRLAPRESVLVVFNGQVASDAAGTLVNTASAISDNNPEGVESTVTTVVQALADLALDVTSTPTVQAGEQVVVTYTVANNGPSTAENVVVTATFPSEVTPPAGWTLVGGNVYTYSVGSVGAGETVVITALVTTTTNIEPGTSIQFTGVTGGSTPDADIANNSDNADTSILSTADLALTKTGDPTSVAAGELVTYTVVVTNNGPSAAQSVDVKDALPLGIGLISATVVRSGSGPAACGGPVCQAGDMAVGEVLTVTVVGRVAPSVADGSVLVNTATVFSALPDPNTDNNTDSAATDVTRAVQLYLRKLAPATITAGTSLRYTLIVTNAGPSLASNVVVTDVLPLELTLHGATVNGLPDACSLAGQTLSCRVGDLAPNGLAQIVIDAFVAANAAGTLVNTAQATSAETPEPVDVEAVTTVQSRSDLKLVKDATPTTGAGQTIVYTLTVVNLGPSDAQGVVVNDSLPPGVTYESSSNCAPAGATVICPASGSGFTLTAGSNAGFTITMRADAALPLGVSLENRATVTATTPDTDMSNNTDVADTSIVAEADLSVLKSGPDTLVAGKLVTYTIRVANAGPSTAHAVDVKDSLPPGIDLVQASVQRTGNDLALCAGAVCQMGDVPPGEAITVTVVGKVKPDLLPGQTLVNMAGVFAGTTDPVNENNSDTSAGTVTVISSLKVDKTALTDQARPDSPLSYNIRVRNDGPSTARDVIVTDDLPAQVTYQGATADCTLNGSGQVICALGDLLPGQTVNFQIYVRVKADVAINAVLRNHVAVTSPTPQDEDAVLEDEVETPVKEPSGPPADLAITKSVQPTLAQAGDVITYTLLITNYGPATALNATVVDFLPLGLELINAAPTQGNCSVGLTCLLGNIAPYDPSNPAAGGRARITIIARVLPSAIRGEALHNVAFIQSDNPDPNPANNEDDADVLVGPLASIVIEKATNGKDADLPPGPVIESGKPVTWTYAVTNTGTLHLTEVKVVDSREGAVTCPQTTLAPGASMTCIKTGIASSGQYSNTGTVSAMPPTGPEVTDSDDSHYIGDLFTIDIPIIILQPNMPSIDVEKFTNGDDADIPPGPGLLVGSKVTWTYLVVNSGATRLTDIVVKDDKIGVIRCPKTALAPAESLTCVATGTAGPGQYGNVAQVVGTSPRGVVVTDVDLSHYFGTSVVPPDGGGLCSDSIIVQYGNYPKREVKLTSAPVAVIGFGAALSARVPFTVTMKDGELASGSYLGWNNDYQAMGRGPSWTLVATGDDKHPKVRWLYTFQVYVVEAGTLCGASILFQYDPPEPGVIPADATLIPGLDLDQGLPMDEARALAERLGLTDAVEALDEAAELVAGAGGSSPDDPQRLHFPLITR